MANKTSKETDPATNALSELQKAGFGNMMGMSTAWMEAVSDMGAEVVSFVADRIQEDVKAQHKMLHCKDISELQHIQAEFFQKAVEQYQAETGKLVEMGAAAFAPDKDDEQS